MLAPQTIALASLFIPMAILITYMDVRYRRIPNKLVLVTLLGGLLLNTIFGGTHGFLASLGGFALLSQFLNMTLGIAFLVFCSAFAGTSYSVVRNLKVAAGLIAIAFAFQKLLGLNLPLY